MINQHELMKPSLVNCTYLLGVGEYSWNYSRQQKKWVRGLRLNETVGFIDDVIARISYALVVGFMSTTFDRIHATYRYPAGKHRTLRSLLCYHCWNTRNSDYSVSLLVLICELSIRSVLSRILYAVYQHLVLSVWYAWGRCIPCPSKSERYAVLRLRSSVWSILTHSMIVHCSRSTTCLHPFA